MVYLQGLLFQPLKNQIPRLQPHLLFFSKINCPKAPSKRKHPSSIKLGFSKVDNFKKYLQKKAKKIKSIWTQKISRLQAGYLASQLAQDLSVVASFQACLEEEYRYMRELSLFGAWLRVSILRAHRQSCYFRLNLHFYLLDAVWTRNFT